jgi:hypothetical protein
MTKEEKIRKGQGSRLRMMRLAASFTSARSAALAAGWPESTYRAHESGTRTIDPGDAARYSMWFLQQGAKGENFTGRWIIYGDDDDLAEASLDDLIRGESAAFKAKAIDAILNLKKR